MLFPKDQSVFVEKTSETMTIGWRWKKEVGQMIVVMGSLYGGLFLVLPFLPDKHGQSSDPALTRGLFFTVIPLLAFILSMGVAWLRTRTVITAERMKIVVRSRPLGPRKEITFATEGVQQFFVESAPSGRYSTLYVMHPDSTVQAIGSNFRTTVAAYQVCHELQDWCGLEDLPVYGHNTLPDQPGPRKP